MEINQEVLSTDLTTPVLLDIGAAALGAFRDAILPFLSEDLLCREVVVTDVSTEFGPVVSVSFDAGDVGGIAQPALPNNCALCVTKMTAARGKSARGRFYIPGLPTNERTGVNRMQPTWIGSMTGALDDFFAALTTAGYTPLIVSRVTAGADRGSGLVQVMTQYRIYDSVVDSQRRRLPGRGN